MHDDITIVGGGLVGLSLAAALAPNQRQITLIDKLDPRHRGQDQRAIALAFGSQQILQRLQVWDELAPQTAAIERIHISNQGRFGRATLFPHHGNQAQLGFIMRAGDGERALLKRLATQKNLQILAPDEVKITRVHRQHLEIHLASGACRQTQLLIAADGADSPLREAFQIAVHHRDYDQSAVIAEVTPQFAGHGVAFERFTDDGPVALLPLLQNRYAVVCTVAKGQQNAVLALADDAFCHYLQQRFGERLGRFSEPSARTAYSLRLLQAKRYVGPRLALVGNAAHTLHPIAGQGFNLGLRDVMGLAALLNGVAADTDVGQASLLRQYEKQRLADQQLLVNFTDGLAWLFTSKLPGVGLARNLGLLAFDALPSLKRPLVRRAMGL